MRKKYTFIVGILVVSLFFFLGSSCQKLILFNKKKKLFSKLEEKIKQQVKEFKGDYSFLIKDLTFPSLKLAFGEEKVFPAASLVKLPLLAVAFSAVRENKIFLDKVTVIERKDIAGGSGMIKKMNLPLKVTWGKLLELMIAESDNTATNKVIDLLGFDYIQSSFKELGLRKTSLVRGMMDFSKRRKGIENYTSVCDIAYLLTKIYNKQLIDEELSAAALSLLKKQKGNDRLKAYLPKNIAVAHKTGLERGVVHDAGIIFSPGGDYIICVLTSGIKDYRKAKKFIAKLSLITYNLYQGTVAKCNNP
ncbi:MAG: class A beta-lactamase-related serine hydrolase [Candidatus Omnitrophica bacterium]|nr:class A beta-lactamase-related serine hydrolase [Candidatus Omnitrophota bacterium]MBU0878862.1 class A beta-lactamase-related serine hydrolase [Candidatus Omnitrophota bacterium]MBU0897058.1 class A beta-lactamase-related serine hydrolase [Candidatus Omnitrophota bacterium]MBU1810899.1 class A beta-lactamase-related serine hydrolase [Candidatus Omnitrophota bacterium]